MTSWVTVPLITQCLAQFCFFLSPLFIALSPQKGPDQAQTKHLFSIPSISFCFHLSSFVFLNTNFLMSLEARALQSSTVSPAANVSQAGHCSPASLSSQRTAPARPRTLFQELPSKIVLFQVAYISLAHLSSQHDPAQQLFAAKASSHSSSMFSTSQNVSRRLLFLAQHFPHFPSNLWSLRWAHTEGFVSPDSGWNQSRVDEFCGSIFSGTVSETREVS